MTGAPDNGRAASPVNIGPIVEGLTAAVGAALVMGAACADQAWFDRHFLPVFFVSHAEFVRGEIAARICVAVLGLILIVAVRPRVGRAAAKLSSPLAAASAVARILLALGLAVAVSEWALRAYFPRAREEAPPTEEPLRRRDPVLGWTFVPSRVGADIIDGRRIEYAFDDHGDRIAGLNRPVDPRRPTVLFAGESIMAGFGLRWEETIPALVGADLRVQTANLAVFGYADDQVAMRLAREAPRFSQPIEAVILFSPGLLFRDLDQDRPHLEPGLVWRPAAAGWRLAALARFYIPYNSEGAIDRLVAQARAELAADVALARGRHAIALIVVPRFGREDAMERRLRQKILDDAGLPYIEVPLDPAWRIPHDAHPNALGARVIAAAITARLRQDLAADRHGQRLAALHRP